MDNFGMERTHDKNGKKIPFWIPNDFCNDCEHFIENTSAACGCGCADDCALTGDRAYRAMYMNKCVR
jgi:hypothetical protein